MSEHEPPHLDYAPQTRRKARRRVIVAVVSVVLVAGLWRWGPAAWNHAQLLHVQDRCLSYTPNEGLVVYQDIGTAMKFTLCNRDLQRFDSLRDPPALDADATAFMHEMRNKSGRRLVIVEASLMVNLLGEPVLILDVRVFQPATPFFRGAMRGSSHIQMVDIGRPNIKDPKLHPLTLYAGQIDPSDPSHFTIPYDLASMRGTLDGWLGDNDQVVIENRKPARQ